MGKASPSPVKTEAGALPKPAGRSRAEPTGHCEWYATVLLVQGCTSPPPASSVSFAGLLARVPVLAAYAHRTEPSQGEAASREATNAKGRIGTMHNGEDLA